MTGVTQHPVNSPAHCLRGETATMHGSVGDASTRSEIAEQHQNC